MCRNKREVFGSPRHSLLLLTILLRISRKTDSLRRGLASGFLCVAGLLSLGSGCSARLRMEGMVLRVDRVAQTMLVSHRSVAGVMPAMVMPFHVARARELAIVSAGSRIRFELRGQGAHRVRVIDTRNAGDFVFPHADEELKPGEAVPDFSLIDQTGRPLTLASLRGRVVLVNFLYTRCPLPEVCPRLAASFASLQRRFAAEMPAGLVLVSITLDPQYDTPEILARYAGTMKARPGGWHFLTGDTTPVARRFGLIHWAEEGVIVHNSQTAIIDRQGRLAAMVEGSTYRLEQLADLVSQELSKHQ